MTGMAASRLPPALQDDSEEELSDERIQQLLREAETRLRALPRSASTGEIGQSGDFLHSEKSISSLRRAKIDTGNVPTSYLSEKDGILRFASARLLDKEQKKLSNRLRRAEDPIKKMAKLHKDKKPTAGSEWFDLPRTAMTPELKKDLQLLRMRPVLDPKRHYKKEGGKGKIPQYSQVGTVIEGPTEFYSARIPNKERKRTFVDETLAYEEKSGRFKAKYEDIQAAKTSGKKAYYKKLQEKRKRLRR